MLAEVRVFFSLRFQQKYIYPHSYFAKRCKTPNSQKSNAYFTKAFKTPLCCCNGVHTTIFSRAIVINIYQVPGIISIHVLRHSTHHSEFTTPQQYYCMHQIYHIQLKTLFFRTAGIEAHVAHLHQLPYCIVVLGTVVARK